MRDIDFDGLMGHLKDYKIDASPVGDRMLGDEWADWDGQAGMTVRAGRRLFLTLSAVALAISCIFGFTFVYLISPRLEGWHPWLVPIAWAVPLVFTSASALWFALLVATIILGRDVFPFRKAPDLFMNFVFSRAFRLADLLGISRDGVGHSFVRVSNTISRATISCGCKERLLVLLPRCLSKEELSTINDLKGRYGFEVHTVSGGELARKKVKELKPTAVIGVACERDLVSGIRDVGRRISVIGIPNKRPDGPCRNTHIDIAELIDAVEFYLGPPKEPSLVAGR